MAVFSRSFHSHPVFCVECVKWEKGNSSTLWIWILRKILRLKSLNFNHRWHDSVCVFSAIFLYQLARINYPYLLNCLPNIGQITDFNMFNDLLSNELIYVNIRCSLQSQLQFKYLECENLIRSKKSQTLTSNRMNSFNETESFMSIFYRKTNLTQLYSLSTEKDHIYCCQHTHTHKWNVDIYSVCARRIKKNYIVLTLDMLKK